MASLFLRGYLQSARLYRSVPLALLPVAGMLRADPAHALVIPDYLLNGPEIPTTGVLKLRDEQIEGVYDMSGELVPGKFVAPNVWRPDAPFSLGSYEVRRLGDVTDSWGGEFEAVSALMGNLPNLSLALRTYYSIGAATKEVCCGSDLELYAEAFPDCATPGACVGEPACVPLAYQQTLYFAAGLDESALPAAVVGQLDVTQASDSENALGGMPVDPALSEYCAAAEVFNWMDVSTTRLEGCLQHEPEVVEDYVVPDDSLFFTSIEYCLLPPPDYRSQWCSAMFPQCDRDLIVSSFEQRDRQVLLCSNYYDLCERAVPDSPPTPSQPDASGPFLGGTAPAGSQAPATSDSGALNPESTPSQASEAPGLHGVAEPSEGCSLSLGSRALGRCAWLITLAGALGASVVRRRQRSVARRGTMRS